MRRGALFLAVIAAAVCIGLAAHADRRPTSTSEQEAGFESPEAGSGDMALDQQRQPSFQSWTRPPGPPRVALQAGHWLSSEVPDELENLRGNGARGGGRLEWEVNLEIAQKAAELIGARGVVVDILPTAIPPGHYADAFVAIHADGNPDPSVSGFKVATPRRDLSGQARALADLLAARYGDATGMAIDPSVTRNMRGYYAFNWRRYEHSLHPMTPAAILETGFLTSPDDRGVIVSGQDRAAEGVSRAVLDFLEEQGLLEAPRIDVSGAIVI